MSWGPSGRLAARAGAAPAPRDGGPRRPGPRLRILASLALALLAGAAPAGPAAAQTWVVVDAGGARMGPVIGLHQGFVDVLVTAGDQHAAVRVGRDRFLPGVPQTDLVFQSSDCTGPPLLFAAVDAFEPGLIPLVRLSVVTPEGQILLALDDVPGDALIGSLLNLLDVDDGCQPGAATVPVRPAAPFLDLSRFQPPFELARGEASPAPARGASTRITVKEAEGEEATLGLLVGGDLPQSGQVLLPTDGGATVVTVLKSRVREGTGLVVYASTDCTGTPFLAVDGPGGSEEPRLFALSGLTLERDLLVESGPETTIELGSAASLLSAPACVEAVQGAPPARVRPAALLRAASSLSAPFALAEGPATEDASRSRPGPLTLVDATGQVIGRAFSLVGQKVAVLLAQGRVLAEATASAGGVRGGTRAAWYELPGCQGAPLVVLDGVGEPAPLYPHTALGEDGGLYLADGPLDILTVSSRWDADQEICEQLAGGDQELVQRTRLFLDPARLATPFRVR